MEEQLTQLKTKLARVADLRGAMGVLSWDQETYMPTGATPSRADQMSTLAGLAHQMFVDEEVGSLLEDLSGQVDQLDYASDDAALVRNVWREYRKQVKVPLDLQMEMVRHSSQAKESWRKAREAADFSIFVDDLSHMVELKKRHAEVLGYDDNPYDALIDNFEPGLSYESISEVFTPLKADLDELITAIGEAEQVDDSVLTRRYPKADQMAFSERVAADLGYSFEHGRLDISTHPFTGGGSYLDTRLTTRVDEEFLPSCVMATIHEAGHGIHWQNVSPSLYRQPYRFGLAIAESQSRFYENVIGRSYPFWTYYLPIMQRHFPHLEDVDVEEFYRAVNKVQPSLIRVEADEVTYGMHIMIRFEIENELINEELDVADLPEAWNARMEEYLGVTPPNDAKGVLQDIHWSQGGFGYFPDYLLGSVFASQLWATMLEEMPATIDYIGEGNFAPITEWLALKVQSHGGKFDFLELVERATGKPFSREDYVQYLNEKLGKVYGL